MAVGRTHWLVAPFMAPLLLLVAGCATPTPPAGPAGPAAAPAESGPPKVNRVVMSVVAPANFITFEVRHLAEPNSWPVRPMYDYLVGINNKTSKIEPSLLESWQWSADGKSLSVKLRTGVKLHKDFGELKASDVKFGWERMAKAQPDSTHGQLATWRTVNDIDIVNDYELVFRLKTVDGNFVTALSEQQGGIEVQSKAHFDKLGGPVTFATGPLAGSGPYQYASHRDSEYLRFERVPWKHWRATPDFPEFEFRWAAEASTRQAQLLVGEVHIASLPEDLLQQSVRSGMAVIKGQFPGTRVYGAWRCCMLKEPNDPSQGALYPGSPLLDLRVRRALNKAVNKDEVNKAFFGGKGETMYVNHMYPNRAGWNPDWEKKFKDAYGYDPAAAKALLAEAGYGPSKPLVTNIIVQPLPGVGSGGDLSEALTQYWRAAGVQVNLLQIDGAEYSRVNRERRYDNHLVPSATGSNIWSGWTIWNSSLIVSPTPVQDNAVDKLLRELQGTVDEKKRDELWRKVGDAGFDAYMNLNLLWLPAEVVVNPKVVAGWVFPGDITGAYTHVWEVKGVR